MASLSNSEAAFVFFFLIRTASFCVECFLLRLVHVRQRFVSSFDFKVAAPFSSDAGPGWSDFTIPGRMATSASKKRKRESFSQSSAKGCLQTQANLVRRIAVLRRPTTCRTTVRAAPCSRDAVSFVFGFGFGFVRIVVLIQRNDRCGREGEARK